MRPVKLAKAIVATYALACKWDKNRVGRGSHAIQTVPFRARSPFARWGRDPVPDRRRDWRHDPLHRSARPGEPGDGPRHRERVLACPLGQRGDLATGCDWGGD